VVGEFGQTPVMVGEDLLETFDRLADEVRHAGLTLDLFTMVAINDSDDEVEDERDDEVIAQALDPPQLQLARRRPGALMFAANLVFDRILDDLVVTDGDRESLGIERFTQECLPARFRHRYDPPFVRRLLATATKVAHDLATEGPADRG
jgi:hypothetical protein